MSSHFSIVIAGATGLIGKSTLDMALENEHIDHIYSLSRQRLQRDSTKLTQWLSSNLTPPSIDNISQLPITGIITLGTTLKKAGSKEKLRAIDVELVLSVANEMHALGVKNIYVVSCLGASIKARSYYLRCKGEMEIALQQINFEQITFMHPGPLLGQREEKRTDEQVLQYLMKIFSPLMLGVLVDYKPIESHYVASAIIQLATQKKSIKQKRVQYIKTSQMLASGL
jgi:uncharacterized protein YbjT (DUF2867 family)